ncbi:MAG: 4Fe-4S dicluster domain-containing protein [Candidatus Bathyarchaeota archaeon]|nr:MAG: 4Fe-4S dicluster domain-containing protein [Candidatus Bathyarchaeota archaeon]
MEKLEKSLREIAEKLLSEKKVDLIIGYERGTRPLRTTPCFVNKTEDVQKLIWDSSCDNNLAKYVVDRKEKVGVVAKGCDARLIAVCIAENQVPKENVIIIGVPCLGVVDRKKVESKLEEKEILEATIEGEKIKVKGEEFELLLAKNDFLCDSCLTCKHRNPPIQDVLVGEEVPELTEVNEFTEVENLEAMAAEERWNHFNGELSKCIRCYACRSVCPLCYCKTCFVDQSIPTWFGKTNDLSDTMIYHIVRALHVAGRCVDCGACSRVCPVNINLRELMKKIEKIVKERYNFKAGLSLEEAPPLGDFKSEDPQEFIK